ncbi:hypothetical protein ABZ930_01875 [Streptomyces sp. NPDC046716]
MGSFVQALLVKVGLMLAEALVVRVVQEMYAAYARSRQVATATA